MRIYDVLTSLVTKINNIETTASAAKLAAHPIGSIYITTINENPTNELGGDWVRIQECFLYSVSEDTSLGHATLTTGPIVADEGSFSYTIAIENMPAHNHGNQTAAHNHGEAGWHAHGTPYRYDGDWCGSGKRSAVNGHTTANASTYGAGNHTHTGAGNHEHQIQGSGKAMSIKPPLLKVYMWKRIA